MHVMWRKGKRTRGQECVGPQCVTVSGSNARLCLLVLLNGIKARSMWAASEPKPDPVSVCGLS